MPDQYLLPTADAVITDTLEAMYEKRPTCFPHLNLRSGVYWHPILGFRAQAALMIQKLADRAARKRLAGNTGQDLIDYVASEFLATPPTGQTFAEGWVTLSRPDDGDLSAGDYPKGTRINRAQGTWLGYTFPAAVYESVTDVHVDAGDTETTIPIRAITAGESANHPIILALNNSNSNITVPNLVPGMVVADFEAGGGSNGPSDDFVRAFAKTSSRGQYGPTSDASKYGALSSSGVRNFLVYDRVSDGSQRILIADEQWGSSKRWAGVVQRAIYDAGLVGFGCKIGVDKIRNKAITVYATISLRDGNYLSDTSDIDDAVRQAVRSYFDDRSDWNVWNKDSLCSAISLAHSKILVCTDVFMIAAGFAGQVPEILTPDYTQEQFHFLLSANAMKITYTGPA